jgi:predicted aldo/keto reductase-like oxidoreductase
MKSQGGGQVRTDTQSELELAGRFMEKGFTDAQAKLKAVWEQPGIASICTEMPNMTLLMSNVAAALDKTTLSTRDLNLLQQYACETRSNYCIGCTDVCQPVITGDIPIGHVMRCLMYARSYGDRHRARAQFQKIPLHIRRKIKKTDYEPAEQRCPQKIAIGQLMGQAIEELG